jgi:hypothetical protein
MAINFFDAICVYEAGTRLEAMTPTTNLHI